MIHCFFCFVAVKAEPVLTQVLARRTYAQRQQTIAKFNQQYELVSRDATGNRISG